MKLLDWIKGTFAKAPDGQPAVEPPARAPERIENPAAEPTPAAAPAQSEEYAAAIETTLEITPSPPEEDPISLEPPPQIEAPPPPSPVAPPIHINLSPAGIPDESEIERRRGMVRQFFNDYWSSVEDKPSTFAERLDGAEHYINERVAAGGEPWQLDHATRKQLGLPASRKR